MPPLPIPRTPARRHPRHRPGPGQRHQQGVVLVVSLILLVVMSILGVTAMQGTLLQEKMASNLRDKSIAFQAAESALRDAENALLTGAANQFVNDDGLYSWTNTSLNPRTDSFWANSDNYATYGGNSLDHVDSAPTYIIQQMNPSFGSGGDSKEAGTPSTSGYYRITARGVGGNTNSVAIVQSIYKL